MKSETLEYALFSLSEMERRYDRARELMRQRQVGVLFVSGEENFQYFTGTTGSIALHHSVTRPSIFILPLEGEPIILTQNPENVEMGTYVEDVRRYRDLFGFPVDFAREAIEGTGIRAGKIGAELGQEQRMGMPVGSYLGLVETMSDCTFVDAADILISLRMVKSLEEIAYMRQAAEITTRARQRLFDMVHAGMTERDVARMMRRLILEEGGDRASFVILQIDLPGSSNPFHYDRPVLKDTVLAIDAGSYVGTHTIDYVRMAVLGKATNQQKEVHAASIEVSQRIAEALCPGISCAELYEVGEAAIRDVGSRMPGLVSSGPSRMGHGQGIMVTEPPSINPGDHTTLEPGTVISTEPGVRSGDVPFMWEDVHVITEDGHEQITQETTELREIDF